MLQRHHGPANEKRPTENSWALDFGGGTRNRTRVRNSEQIVTPGPLALGFVSVAIEVSVMEKQKIQKAIKLNRTKQEQWQ
jgi:hypothetical protein